MIRMLDKYDKAVVHLLDNPGLASHSWGSPRTADGGCLFKFAPASAGVPVGCLTMIRADYVRNEEGWPISGSRFPNIDRDLRGDSLIPAPSAAIKQGLSADQLNTFAIYQRRYDAAVTAERSAT